MCPVPSTRKPLSSRPGSLWARGVSSPAFQRGGIGRHGPDHGIFVPFPQWVSNTLTPFTYIDYEAKADQLHVFAYHAFVDELTLIKTQSIFELA